MALNWNVEKVIAAKGRDFVWKQDGEEDGEPTYRLNGRTDCMIWATVMVDLGEITAKNAKRFYERVFMFETITGPINSNGERTSMQDVEDHIGLRTNVTDTTNAQFAKRMMRSAAEKAQREAARAVN